MRPAAVRMLFQILTRALQLVAQAREALGPERDALDKALALLEEAKAWLPTPRSAKGGKPPRLPKTTPEELLFRAVAELRWFKGISQRAGRGAHMRVVPDWLLHVNPLVDAAIGHLKEAWLGYLYAHGLPSHLKPWRTFSWSGGTLFDLLLGATFSFLVNYFGLEGTGGGWWEQLWRTALVGGWATVVAVALRFFAYPRRRPGQPVLVAKHAIFLRLLPLAAGLTAWPALGLLLPCPARLVGLLCLTAFSIACPRLIQALRLLFLPEGARVLVLPGLFVVFLPRLAAWSDERVFAGWA